ncbi:MAG: class I SAM-dependent methyltransferase [Coleofasciculaceae cyanobacterium]
MDKNNPELLEKIRQQFNTGPYPRTAIEKSPKEEPDLFYIHNLVTSFYLRNKKIPDTQDKLILDVGCGTGYKSLALAQANPGARIFSVDISESSIEIAKKRLQYHGFDNVEFHVLSLQDLPKLNIKFDYINCDELLYLLPEPAIGLQAMKSVLKSEGIIRANLHSSRQREAYYRAQELFKMMGLMDDNPREQEIEMVRETMQALKDGVGLKVNTWEPRREDDEQWYLMNYLLQGDRGFTVPELFSALRASELEFISMVNWRQWNLMDLFKTPDNLPVFLGLALPDASLEEQLHLFELLHPVHRLLDFWCGHPDLAHSFVPVAEWTFSDWQKAKIALHPQLRTADVKTELLRCITQLQPFEISKYLPIAGQSSLIDSTIAACLLPLWESAQQMPSLVARWQQLRPVNPFTLVPTSPEDAFEVLKQALIGLEDWGYVLVERQS